MLRDNCILFLIIHQHTLMSILIYFNSIYLYRPNNICNSSRALNFYTFTYLSFWFFKNTAKYYTIFSCSKYFHLPIFNPHLSITSNNPISTDVILTFMSTEMSTLYTVYFIIKLYFLYIIIRFSINKRNMLFSQARPNRYSKIGFSCLNGNIYIYTYYCNT